MVCLFLIISTNEAKVKAMPKILNNIWNAKNGSLDVYGKFWSDLLCDISIAINSFEEQ
ncbi:hypothetical protein Syun_020177 [Stephania yunnanensis]|uniref:Uncharacterized protein n=1 Tax=Stephania yunnanensis TaxID=152371 RepID=A0AAP0NPR4_9MAGN